MKKKFLPILLSLCLILVMAPVTALAADAVTTEEDLKNAIKSGSAVTLGGDITLSDTLEIASDQSVTLNLGGYTLTGASRKDVISNKGTLTVTGSGSVTSIGDGGTLVNYPGATANLSGGTWTGDGWYTIKNLGTMTITSGTTVTLGNGKSSLIANGWYNASSPGTNDRGAIHESGATAKLTITGGTFSGGMNSVKNDDYGDLEIIDGSFSNTYGPTLLNWNNATVSGGTFDASDSSSAVVANGYFGENVGDAGKLTITGGTFVGNDNSSVIGYGDGSNKGGTISISNATVEGSIVENSNYPFDVVINSGTFTKAVPTSYVATSAVEISLTSGENTTYYVGTSEKAAAQAANAKSGDTIAVLTGSVALTDVAEGVTVKNETTDGTVSVNGSAVAANGTLTVAHTHSAVKTEAKAATSTTAGNIAYWYCPDCGKYFSDEALTKEITKADTVIKATGSTDTKDPTKPDTGKSDTTAPQTGDASNLILWFALLSVSAAGLVGTVICGRKRKQSSR